MLSKFDVMKIWEKEYEKESGRPAYIVYNGYTVDYVEWVFERMHNWIDVDVKDKLPGNGERVIVYGKFEHHKVMHVIDNINFDKGLFKNEYATPLKKVTYWMPLPEPPE